MFATFLSRSFIVSKLLSLVLHLMMVVFLYERELLSFEKSIRHERRGIAVDKINRGWVEETCISCCQCVEICPEVFELEGETASVKGGADLTLTEKIIEAEEACPVEAIHHD